MALHARRVGEHDAIDPERRELREEAAQHLRARQRQQEIDRRTRRRRLGKPAGQHDRVVRHLAHDGGTAVAIDQADPDLVAGHDLEHVLQVRGPAAGQSRRVIVTELLRFDQDQIHDRS
jgi:hypothetical protein